MSASIDTTATVVVGRRDIEEAAAAVEDDSGPEEENDCDNTINDDSKKNERPPLCRSSRVKGYILLLVSAGINLEAVIRLFKKQNYFQNTNAADVNWCIVLDNLNSFYDFVIFRPSESDAAIRYAMAAASMTIIITFFVILCSSLWPKVI